MQKLDEQKPIQRTSMKLTQTLENLNACTEARVFAKGKTIEQAVQQCHRGDWLLWLAARLNVDNRLLCLANGKCAETVLHLMTDQRSRDAVHFALDYGNGLTTNQLIKDIAHDARCAYYNHVHQMNACIPDSDECIKFKSFCYAALAADFAVWNGLSLGDSALPAMYAIGYHVRESSQTAMTESQLQTAEICREILGQEIIKKINNLIK